MRKDPKQAKRIIVFTVFMIVSILIGFFTGMLMSNAAPDWNAFQQSVLPRLRSIVPFLYIAIPLLLICITLGQLSFAARLTKAWDGENEAIVNEAQERLSYASACISVLVICSYFLFSALFAVDLYLPKPGYPKWILIAAGIWELLQIIAYIMLSHRVVEAEKKLNPEKQGNVLDVSFSKDYLNSFDEAEKQQTWQAGFAGYRAGTTCCLILWIISFISMMFANTGFLPVIVVCTIWLVMTIAYLRACMAYQRKNNNND